MLAVKANGHRIFTLRWVSYRLVAVCCIVLRKRFGIPSEESSTNEIVECLSLFTTKTSVLTEPADTTKIISPNAAGRNSRNLLGNSLASVHVPCVCFFCAYAGIVG